MKGNTLLHEFAIIVVAGVVDPTPGLDSRARYNTDYCKLVLAWFIYWKRTHLT
jgi:hypothetical protein